MIISFQELSAWLEGLFGLYTQKSFLSTKYSHTEMILTDNKISIFIIKNDEQTDDFKSLNFYKSICERSIFRDLVVVEVALLVYFDFPIKDNKMCKKYENLGAIRCDNELNRKIISASESCSRKKEWKTVNTTSEVSNASFRQILLRDWKHKKSYFTVHMVHKISQLIRDYDPNFAHLHFDFLFPTHVDSTFYQLLLFKKANFGVISKNSTSIKFSRPDMISTDESILTNFIVNPAIL